ncbi:hypothetical protein MNV49_007483 [Pseudohyphozyma bogoriensis]|nr:hypothetical protein MNV49_007483 [Pseudohyphozyma bogoriensis]
MVCRVRQRDDDAKSGVGAQRGGGVHKKWVREVGGESSGDESGSTTSSLFSARFPKRYFILKAHSDEDLQDAVTTGVWRTQGHNEETLDQAYRTASEGVYLVFSVNKSGEWYGYAKMAGPVIALVDGHGHGHVDALSSSRIAQQQPADALGSPFRISWVQIFDLVLMR